MNQQSRVWVFQINRKLNPQEETIILAKLQDFTKNWTAHQVPLAADAFIKYHQFIVLTVDETKTKASGCSIDSATHAMQALEKEFQIELYNRQLFTYKNNNEVITLNAKEFQSAIDQGIINSDTIVFNNLVQTVFDFENKWEIAIKDSWHVNLFNLNTEKIEN